MSQNTPPAGPPSSYPEGANPPAAPYPPQPGQYAPQQGGYPAPGAYQGQPNAYPGAPAPYGYQGGPAGPVVGNKSFLTTWLLSLLLGGLGIDRFYLGKVGTGILKLITLGGIGIWSLIDLIFVLTNKQTDKQGNKLAGYEQHKKVALIVTLAFVLLSIILKVSTGGGTTNAASTAPVVAPAVTAPSAAAPSAAAPAVGQVGQAVTVDLGNGNVAKVTIESAAYKPTINQFSTPKNGGYLVLDVLWETQSGKTSSNPLYFMAKDAAGHQSNTDITVDGALGSGTILPGDKARGAVAFDIAPGADTVIVTDQLLQEAARFQVNAG